MANNGKKPSPATINGETGDVERIPKKKKRVRCKLETPADILSETYRLYRRAKEDGAEPTKLVWILGELRKAQETDNLATQIEQLKAMYIRYGVPDLLAAPGEDLEESATIQ